MELDGTFLDYVRHASLTRLKNRISTVKTLTDRNEQSYQFYAPSDGLVTARDSFTTWELTAPDAMFRFQDIGSMTLYGFLNLLADYLEYNPVLCWEEVMPEAEATLYPAINSAFLGVTPSFSGNSQTAAGSRVINSIQSLQRGFFELSNWLRIACGRSSAAASIPMSDLVQADAEKRVYQFLVAGGGATLTFRFLFYPYITPELDRESGAPYVARNATRDVFYTTLEEALGMADAGDRIDLLRDYTMNESASVPDQVTLCIPSSGNYNDSVTGTNIISRLHGGAAYATLTIAKWKNLTVQAGATLLIAGNQMSWYVDASCQNGNYGAIRLLDSSEIRVNGSCYARGAIYGTTFGGVNVNSGGALYLLMQVRDWRGGTATQNAYSAGVWPFNLWELRGCQAEIAVNSGASLYGTLYIAAGGSGGIQNIPLVDGEGVFQIETGSLVISKDGGRMTIGILGAVTVKNITMQIQIGIFSYTFTSSGTQLPFYNTDILVVSNASLTVNNEIKLLPGCSFIVLGTMTVQSDAAIYLYRAADYSSDFFHHYDYDPELPDEDAALTVESGGAAGGNIFVSGAGSETIDEYNQSESRAVAVRFRAWSNGS